MLILSYQLTLVSYDLVSIDFNEFVCLCENGDHTEIHTLTIDLNTGQRLGMDQLFATSTDVLHQVWWQQLKQENQWVTSDDFQALDPVFTGFEGAALTADGFSLNAELETNEGGPIRLGTYFRFDEPEGRIDPAIATRAASGAAVALPIQEGCGC